MEELFGKSMPSVIKDPFYGEHISAIHMHANKSVFSGLFTFTASVEFRNGDTEGRQEFRADNLGGLYQKVVDFCMSLEKK
jgi:hypothetical protein